MTEIDRSTERLFNRDKFAWGLCLYYYRIVVIIM